MEAVNFNVAPAANTNTSPKPAISAEFETFIRMLTVQMQNQDPLNPMESSDFATQLATFSSVEQQVLTNELLTNLSGIVAQSDIAAFSDWIGKEVRLSAPVQFTGNDIELYLHPAPSVTRSVLVVTNEHGTEVERRDIDPFIEQMSWMGEYEDGTPFADGAYSFQVEQYSGDTMIGVSQVDHYARVTEVSAAAGSPLLTLDNGTVINSLYVSSLRDTGLNDAG